MTQFDPVLVEIVNNELAAIAEEMAIVVWKCAQSPTVKSGDFATAIADGRGRVLVPGTGAAFQLSLCHEVVSNVIAAFGDEIDPGDVFVTNDPFAGMTHLPDLAVVTPVFLEGKRAAFAFAYSHHTDIGGRIPGGLSSHATSLYEEGVRIPVVRLHSAGVPDDEIVELVLANVRTPAEFLFDLQAKVAGCRRGAESLADVIAKRGLTAFEQACDHFVDYADRSTRAAIADVPDGTYTEELVIREEDVNADGEITIRMTLRVEGDELTVDFSGTSPQADRGINLPLAMTRAAVYGGVHCVLAGDVPANNGFFRPIEVVAPEQSLVNPSFPAAVGGRATVFFSLYDLVFAALAQALPDRVLASCESADVLHFQCIDLEGVPHSVFDVYFGGWGARPDKDGIDSVAPIYLGSYGCIEAEIQERDHPILVEGFGLLPDSGGPGRFRGSLGVFRQWRFLEPGAVMVRSLRVTETVGLSGGRGGRHAETVLNPGPSERAIPLQTHAHFDVEAGDRVFHTTAGAGGHGDPFERDPEAVLADVLNEKVSIESAERDYGVAILSAAGGVDAERTDALRASRAGVP